MEEVYSTDGNRKIMEINVENRITYVGRLFHSHWVKGGRCVGTDTLKVGPNGTEVIKGTCIQIPIHSNPFNVA